MKAIKYMIISVIATLILALIFYLFVLVVDLPLSPLANKLPGNSFFWILVSCAFLLGLLLGWLAYQVRSYMANHQKGIKRGLLWGAIILGAIFIFSWLGRFW